MEQTQGRTWLFLDELIRTGNVPETRVRTATILGVILSFGIVNIQLCRPMILSKRRLGTND